LSRVQVFLFWFHHLITNIP